MNARAMLAAALLACAVGGPAAAFTIPAPPFFAAAMEYMDEQGIGDACVQVRVRVGKPSEIEVTRSSGDPTFDALAAKGLGLEIDVMERYPIESHKADAQGWRSVPLKFERRSRRNTKVLGCATAGAAS